MGSKTLFSPVSSIISGSCLKHCSSTVGYLTDFSRIFMRLINAHTGIIMGPDLITLL